jgi:hypothetical protein
MTEPVSSLWTNVLITVGGLITALCGSCTAYFLAIGAADNTGYRSVVLLFATVIGGLPTAIGGLLLWWGLRRRARAKRPKIPTDVF